MLIPGLILTILAVLASLIVLLIGLVGRLVLKFMKEELHLDFKIGSDKKD
jgi:hypothetical protein